MFYCDKCATKNEWPNSFSKSQGRCEICEEVAVCNDMKSSLLPRKEVPDDYKFTTAWLLENMEDTTWLAKDSSVARTNFIFTNEAWDAKWFDTEQEAIDWRVTYGLDPKLEAIEHGFYSERVKK